MNEETKEAKSRPDYSIEYDAEHPMQAEMLTVQFNLNSFAANPHGTALLRGMVEELKAEALRVIIGKRQEAVKDRAKILVPSGSKVPLNLH